MKKYIILFICVILLVSCATSKSERSVMVDNSVYEKYGIPKEMSVVDIRELENYDKLTGNVIIVNQSPFDINEMTLYCIGEKKDPEKLAAFAGSFNTIPSAKKKKITLDKDVKISNMQYVVFSVDSPKSANVYVYEARERKHDLYLYLTGR